jgi:hypothetical protein
LLSQPPPSIKTTMPGGFVLKGWPTPALASPLDESTTDSATAWSASALARSTYLSLERNLQGANAVDLGARVDLVYGPDQPYAALGLPVAPPGVSSLGIPQLYVEAGQPELSFKLGRFYSILGDLADATPYEFLKTGFFDRRYGEPLTHTGVLATTRMPLAGGTAVVRAGVVNGWDTVDDGSIDPAMLGGVAWQKDGVLWVALNHIAGRQSVEGYPQYDADRRLTTLNVGVKPFEGATYTFQRDWGQQDADPALGLAESWGGSMHNLFVEIGPCEILDSDRLQIGLSYDSYDKVGGNVPGYASAFAPPLQDLSVAAEYTGELPSAQGGPARTVTIRPSLRWTERESAAAAAGSPVGDETIWQFSGSLYVRVSF